MVDSLAILNTAEDQSRLVGLSTAREHCNAMTNRFCRRVAIHALRALVPGYNIAFEIDAEDSIIRVLDNRRQARLQSYCLLPVGDVTGDFGRADEPPVG